MCDTADSKQPKKTEELLRHSLIASLYRGFVDLKRENLELILKNVALLNQNIPVAIVAVVGPKFSGKSFLTNFLIAYLENAGEGSWMSDIINRTKKKEPMMERGYSWDSVHSENFFRGELGVSGIYLWPKPYLMKKGGEDDGILIWIMHMDIHEAESVEPLEKFLALACSMVLEIKGNNDKIRLLEHHRQSISQIHPLHLVTEDDFCKSASFVIRSKEKAVSGPTMTDDEAKEKLLELVADPERKEVYKKLLQKFAHVNLAWIKDAPGPLQNEDGVLNEATLKPMFSAIKKIVKQVLDDQEIIAKTTLTGTLTLGDMKNFLKNVADKATEWEKKAQNKEQPTRPQCNDQVAESTATKEANKSQDIMEIGNKRPELASPKIVQKNAEQLRQKQPVFVKLGSTPVSKHDQDSKKHPEIHTTYGGSNLMQLRSESVDDSVPSPSRNAQVTLETGSTQVPKHEQALEKHPEMYTFYGGSKPLQLRSESAGSFPSPPQNERETSSSVMHNKIKASTNRFAKSTSTHHSSQLGHATPQPWTSAETIIETMEVDDFVMVLNNEDIQNESLHESSVEKVMEPTVVRSDLLQNMDVDDPPLNMQHEMVDLTKVDNVTNEVKKQNQEEKAARVEEAQAAKEAEKVKKATEKAEREVKKAAEKAERDRLKREQEEKERLEEEAARKVMAECLPVAISLIKHGRLQVSVKNWINQELNLQNIREILWRKVYEITFNVVIDEHLQKRIIHPKIWKEFVRQLDGYCKPECLQILNNIFEPVRTFNKGLKKQFDFRGYFSPEKLDQIAQTEHERAMKICVEDEFIVSMVCLAESKIVKVYQEQNSIIAKSESDCRNLAFSQLTDIYHQQMKRYLQEGPYSPEKLQRIHWKLVEKLLEAFRKACTIHDAANEGVPAAAETLRSALNPLVSSYKETNERKLSMMQAEIKKIAQKMKDEYNVKAEEILTKNPDGVEMRILTKLHENVRAEVMKLMEIEIKQKVRKDEPLEKHKQVLQCHIDNYWPEIMKENHKNLQKKLERDEAEQRERLEKEKARQRREEEEKRQARQEAKTSKPSTSDRVLRSALSTSTSRKWEPCSGPVLPPLVFHLQSTNITMAMGIIDDGRPGILANEYGEHKTPAVVALSSEKGLVYGSEAMSTQDDPHESFTWTIEDFFTEPDMSWSKSLVINEQEQRVNSELFLGFLLGKLKIAAESEMNGHYTTAVIAIPFWLSSPQRLKIKYGARAAGFSEVYLVNEASAAAFNFAFSQKRALSSNEVLVISENLDRVDAFVYSYSGPDKKLKMLGNSSTYGINHWSSESRGIIKSVKRQIGHFFSYFTANAPAAGEQSQMVQDVRHACKYAVELARREKSHDNWKVDLKETLYLFENQTKWEAALESVSRDFGRKPGDIKEGTAVLLGAVKLSQAPKEIGNHIRDKMAYDVLRMRDYGASAIHISKNEILPIKFKKFSASLQQNHKMAIFYQENVQENIHHIGKLTANELCSYEYLEPNLEITNEAIVRLQSVFLCSHLEDCIKYLPENTYEWSTDELSPSQLEDLSEFLASILVSLEDPALKQAKADLVQRCHEMIWKINAGDYKIKSDLVKQMVIEKVTYAKEVAEHPSSDSMDVIQAQAEILNKFEEKYKKPVTDKNEPMPGGKEENSH